ncbi:MAG: phosphonate metabolism protein/1,5-bisphosphokinase (PRPP-forming) PhnN [Burkholderiales bacterium]|jgi:phosphonate metabolism protein PhnN/1,5-bisphosphokinase (PRPP-forming)
MTLRELSARLVVVVGASGSGKDSVMAGWLAGLPERVRPRRARRTITRPAHVQSEDHEPVSGPRFDALLERGAFAFHWSAHGLRYGVRHDELAPLLDGRWVVVSGSRAHLPELLQAAPRAWIVEVDAPAGLRAGRLLDRGREADDAVAARLCRELEPVRADLRILNDGPLEAAVATLDAWWRGLAETPR